MLRVREREEMYTLLYISARRKGYGDEGKDRETTGWGVQGGFHERKGEEFCQVGENVFPGRGEKRKRKE